MFWGCWVFLIFFVFLFFRSSCRMVKCCIWKKTLVFEAHSGDQHHPTAFPPPIAAVIYQRPIFDPKPIDDEYFDMRQQPIRSARAAVHQRCVERHDWRRSRSEGPNHEGQVHPRRGQLLVWLQSKYGEWIQRTPAHPQHPQHPQHPRFVR